MKVIRDILQEIKLERFFMQEGGFYVKVVHKNITIGTIDHDGIKIYQSCRHEYKAYNVKNGYEVWENIEKK